MMKLWITWGLLLTTSLLPAGLMASNEAPTAAQGTRTPPIDQLQLSDAVICENLEAFKPLNPSVVFSVTMGSVMCFTAFDHVPKQTSIFHDWIRRDKLVFRKILLLKTPSWASVSSIQLREADIGAWRVEVRDADGNLLRTLRFSITD